MKQKVYYFEKSIKFGNLQKDKMDRDAKGEGTNHQY